MLKIGIPSTGYSAAASWNDLIQHLFEQQVGIVDLDPNYGNEELPEDIDMIIFDGGADVHPVLYGGSYHETLSVNLARDWQEKLIFDFYKNLDTIFLGICRGSQFLNVMMGGTLYEDLQSINLGHNHTHQVTLLDGECLLTYINLEKGDEMTVNSLHHQAVKDLGDSLIPIMIDSNFGVIEGFYSFDGKIRAVQSHPEMADKDYINRIGVLDWLFRTKEF